MGDCIHRKGTRCIPWTSGCCSVNILLVFVVEVAAFLAIAMPLIGCSNGMPDSHVDTTNAKRTERLRGSETARVITVGERRGIHVGGVERAERQHLASVVKARFSDDVRPESVRMLAWACKVVPSRIPPQVIEEVIISCHLANGRGWLVIYLTRDKTSKQFGGRPSQTWDLGLTDYGTSMTSLEVFPRSPTDQELADFVLRTNFGNNEFLHDVVPAIVLVYTQQNRLFQARLESGIAEEEKHHRMTRYEVAIGE